MKAIKQKKKKKKKLKEKLMVSFILFSFYFGHYCNLTFVFFFKQIVFDSLQNSLLDRRSDCGHKKDRYCLGKDSPVLELIYPYQ